MRQQETALQLILQGHLDRAKKALRQLILLGAPPASVAVLTAEYLRRQGRHDDADRLLKVTVSAASEATAEKTRAAQTTQTSGAADPRSSGPEMPGDTDRG